MATRFKPITKNNDIATTRTLLHEAIPVTGTIVSGTYKDENIKNYSHGMFQSVFDYPYLSSSANHIFDITAGYSSLSAMSGATNTQNAKKINIYNQMAQVLVGHDHTGSIKEFDRDGNFSDTDTKHREVIFLNFSRLLTKDEIKKQSFSLTFLTGGAVDARTAVTKTTLSDYGAATTYKTNSPAGEYGILYTGSVNVGSVGNPGVGLVYYQAGVAVITASVFQRAAGKFDPFGLSVALSDINIDAVLTGSNISVACGGLRNRFENLSFNNTTELNSTIYFCRTNFNEFNYSSNPTYLSSSQLRVKTKKTDEPVSYITTIGLYSTDNVLMAVAKLSEPLKKTPANEFTLRVRLDY